MRVKQAQMEYKILSFIFLLMLSIDEGAVMNSIQNTNTSSYLIPCEEGWYLFGDKCYKVFGASKRETWKSAEASCAAHHGSLVTIQSKELQDFLTTFLMLDVSSDVWIGLSDPDRDKNFTWTDGSKLSYTNWDFGKPSRYSNTWDEDMCVEMKYVLRNIKGNWSDSSCYYKRPFMCQTNKSEQSMNHDPRFCTGENAGAWKHKNSCYHAVGEEMSWDDAENYCQTILNGHLLSILDYDGDLFINYVLSDFNREFWVGVKLRDDAALQMWSSGWVWRFRKWQIDNKRYTDGTCVYRKEGSFKSASCSQKFPFVCEVPHVKPPSLKPAPEGWRCPKLSQDWIDLGGDTCYIFETKEKKKWHEADDVCLEKGGRLASISSDAESNAIHHHVMGGRETMLIGLHSLLSDNSVFEWADGTVLDYENWELGPQYDKKYACGAILTADMKWFDESCDFSKEYICSAKKVPPYPHRNNDSALIGSQVPVSVQPTRQRNNVTSLRVQTNCPAVINSIENASSHLIPCEKGWFLFGDNCYKVFEKPKGVKWKSAKAACACHRGSLVNVESKELQIFLTTFFLLDVKSPVWVDSFDNHQHLKPAWYDPPASSRFAGDEHLIPGFRIFYPRRIYYPDENCLKVKMSYYTHKSRGSESTFFSCDTNLPFICQTNKSKQSMNHDPRFCTGENDGAWKYENFCYHIVSEEMSWDDAENYCQTNLSGHLLAIIDGNVDRFINYILLDFKKEYWIGIKIRDAAQQMWSSAWIVGFKKWGSDDTPNMNGTCAYRTKKRVWSSAPCSQKLPFVCEVPHVKLKPAPDKWRCPELSQDWIDLGGDTCYIFETKEPKKWHEADAVCLKKGGHLASISSVAEENAIRRYLMGEPERMLIGLHRSLSNNSVFEWADGTELDYQNWNNIEQNKKTEACGEISTVDMTWNYFSCDEPKEYICSAKKVPIDCQPPDGTNCPADTPWSIIIALLVIAVILFVVGFTIYIYKNRCSKSRYQRRKFFAMSFSAKNGTRSRELVRHDLVIS